jgi:hypothetical protein
MQHTQKPTWVDAHRPASTQCNVNVLFECRDGKLSIEGLVPEVHTLLGPQLAHLIQGQVCCKDALDILTIDLVGGDTVPAVQAKKLQVMAGSAGTHGVSNNNQQTSKVKATGSMHNTRRVLHW